MKSKESIADLYDRHGQDYSDAGQFNVYRIEDFNRATSFPHNRKDFYKITLTTSAQGHDITSPKIRAAFGNLAHMPKMNEDAIADAVIYAISQPANVNINELVLRPLGQTR